MSLSAFDSLAQKESSNWYFGTKAGIRFDISGVVAMTNGSIDTDEGCASISDKCGNLLFYTDGVTVWNKGHGVMSNGNGLYGHSSSTQSAVIVPQPGNDSLYYVFTVDEKAGAKGVCYSIVNVKANAGYGAVIQKNSPLFGPSCEKVGATVHANGTDFWIITHRWNSNEFVTYRLGGAGINPTPVVSAGVTTIAGDANNAIGVLRCSSNGKRIAALHSFLNDVIEVYDFDNQTGILSNGKVFRANDNQPNSTATGAYGAEFSPDSKLLYISSTLLGVGLPSVKQYDVTLPTGSAIKSSEKLIFNGIIGSMQLGPDGRIYCSNYGQNYLSTINNPNIVGSGCNFQYQAVYLGQFNIAKMGLPVFVQSYLDSQITSFMHAGNCVNFTVQFNYLLPPGFTSLQWNFDDPSSGINNSSTLTNPFHDFTQSGTYNVVLVRHSSCGTDTIRKSIYVGVPQFTLGNDASYCGSGQVLLDPLITGNYSFLWQDGSTGQTYTASSSGLYWLEVKDLVSGCTKRDSIQVTFQPYPSFSLGADRNVCEGTSVQLNVAISGASYLWNTGSVDNSITVVGTPGIFWVDVTKDGCTLRDSVSVNYIQKPIVNLGKDTLLCDISGYTLDAGNPGAIYLWNDNVTTQMRTATTSGTYWVKVTKGECAVYDTTAVTFLSKPQFSLGLDKSLCPGNSLLLQPNVPNAEYLWQDGSTKSIFLVTEPATYYVVVKNACGSVSGSIKIIRGYCNVQIPNAFTPNGDRINDKFKPLGLDNAYEYRMEIFNRWGQRVFASQANSNAWDGTFQGQNLPVGAYYYILEYKLNTSERKHVSGCVLLLR